jgi:N-glycosylase/DNA lyase
VFKFRSVRSIVIAPAKTGKESNSKIAVINTAQANKGTVSSPIPKERRLPRVLIKLTAPKREDTPAKCKEKIAKSTDAPAWAILLLRGG